MDYSKILKEIREREGWTQSDLIEKLGISQAGIAGIESGKSKPSAKTAAKIRQLAAEYLPDGLPVGVSAYDWNVSPLAIRNDKGEVIGEEGGRTLRRCMNFICSLGLDEDRKNHLCSLIQWGDVDAQKEIKLLKENIETQKKYITSLEEKIEVLKNRDKK